MAQVTGSDIKTIQASKNLGTVIDNQVSGNNITNIADSRNRNKVNKTQIDGQVHITNYMGINNEGMDIFHTKKISGNELNVVTNPTIYDAKSKNIANANILIAKQEQDKKDKYKPEAPAAAAETGNIEVTPEA